MKPDSRNPSGCCKFQKFWYQNLQNRRGSVMYSQIPTSFQPHSNQILTKFLPHSYQILTKFQVNSDLISTSSQINSK